MLTEEIVEFGFRGHMSLIVHIFQNLVIFMTNQNLQDKSSSELFNAKNVAEDNLPCFPRPGPSDKI